MPPVSDPSVEQSGYRSKHPGSSLLHMLFFDFCRLSAALFLRVVHRAFTLDVDRVPALAEDREKLWAQVSGADFLSDAEKRAMLGLSPMEMSA